MKLLTLAEKIRAAQAENTGPLDSQIDELLTKQGLRPKLKVSIRTVDEWMKQGRLPYIKIGKAVRFRWSDVVAHLERFRVK